jgi:hypothetical protein
MQIWHLSKQTALKEHSTLKIASKTADQSAQGSYDFDINTIFDCHY